MGSDTNAKYVADETDPAKIIVELCGQFYDQSWMPGTAGGMSIKEGSQIYMTPSGVQKERMRPEDIVVYNTDSECYEYNDKSIYEPSASAPLFRAIHDLTNAGACIHTHSTNSVLASMMGSENFEIIDIENIKAIPKVTEPGNYGVLDLLKIPIIDNKPHEEDLEESLIETIKENPGISAVLVRRHGVFVWGKDVWKAKVINEALDYLFNVGFQMKTQLQKSPNSEHYPDPPIVVLILIAFLCLGLFLLLLYGLLLFSKKL